MEDAAITWFEELGYDYAYGPDITGNVDNSEHGLGREQHQGTGHESQLARGRGTNHRQCDAKPPEHGAKAAERRVHAGIVPECGVRLAQAG